MRWLSAALFCSSACLFAVADAAQRRPPRQAPAQVPPGYSLDNATAGLLDLVAGPGYDASTRPLFGRAETVVEVQLRVNQLYALEPDSSTFTMDVRLRLYWNDPRLVAPPDWPSSNGSHYRLLGMVELGNGHDEPYRIWTPDIAFFNQVESTLLDSVVKLDPLTGNVFWSRHFVCKLSNSFFFAAFPFDKQNLTMRITSFSYNKEQMTLSFRSPPVYPEIDPATYSQGTWDFDSYSIGNYLYLQTDDGVLFEMLTFSMLVSRKSGSYYIKTVLPLLLLVALTCVSYWLSADAIPERLGLTITLVLTIVSFYNSTSFMLPPVNYAVTLDWYVFVAFLVSFFALVEVAMVHHLVRRQRNHIVASELDFFCRRFVLPFWALFNVGILVQLPPGSFPYVWLICGILIFLLLFANAWLFAYYIYKRYDLRMKLEATAYGKEKLEDYGEYVAGNVDIGRPGTLRRRAHDIIISSTEGVFDLLHIPRPGGKQLRRLATDADGVGPDAKGTEREKIDRLSIDEDLEKARRARRASALGDGGERGDGNGSVSSRGKKSVADDSDVADGEIV
ncbi:neurotransmitter-gated ion-channel ligand-binding domain-containing protein [Hyaloraphidium curvatum]|nr:neurotransmitter-gated ion-channel ligand-binding domain-containing protein [Hyaloraphidium curvatum]